MYTDASYSGGFGFVCGQHLPEGGFNVIQVGSTVLTNSQKNDSCYELELTAISWTARKAYHFLAHSPQKVTFYTDHTSLAHLESVQLDSVKNPRILRLLADLLFVDSQTKWNC